MKREFTCEWPKEEDKYYKMENRHLFSNCICQCLHYELHANCINSLDICVLPSFTSETYSIFCKFSFDFIYFKKCLTFDTKEYFMVRFYNCMEHIYE